MTILAVVGVPPDSGVMLGARVAVGTRMKFLSGVL